jgi:hypothetical protein
MAKPSRNEKYHNIKLKARSTPVLAKATWSGDQVKD